MKKEIKKLLAEVCDSNNPKYELNTVCIDFKTNRMYSTDTRRLLIVNMDIQTKYDDIYYIDKKTIENSDVHINGNSVHLGRTKIVSDTNNKEMNYPNIDKIVPTNFKHIYEVTGNIVHIAQHILVKHNTYCNPIYINILQGLFYSNDYKYYIKLNEPHLPVVISIEDTQEKEILKYIIMPIIYDDIKKDFKKLRRTK